MIRRLFNRFFCWMQIHDFGAEGDPLPVTCKRCGFKAWCTW